MRDLFELVSQARKGDECAAESLCEELRPRIRAAAHSLLHSPNGCVDASDVIQQTLAKVVKSLPQFRGDNEPQFKAWLSRVLKNTVTDELRRQMPYTSLDKTDSHGRLRDRLLGKASSPSSRIDRIEAAEQLKAALQELTDDQRKAVRMRHLEGLGIAEIAQRLGRSDVAVRQLIHRALIRLGKLLSEN